MTPIVGGGARHRTTRAGDDDLGHVDGERTFAQQRRRAGVYGCRGEVVAVDRRTGQATKQERVADATRVMRDSSDVGVTGASAGDLDDIEVAGYL